jgi:hypothetical protein
MKLVFKLLIPLALVIVSAVASQEISLASADNCDSYSKDKAKCLSSTENNEACSFCTSAAVGVKLFMYS